ncbi:MAG: outer membrane protein, partial [Vitreimonas sp.]
MKSRITTTVALAALMAGTAGAANATEGWYGRGDVGWSFDGESEFTANQNPPNSDFDLGLEHEWTQHLGLGYAMSNGLRFEGELGHRFNQYDDQGIVDDGDVHAWSAMANIFYDFSKGGGLEPYIGVGVGAARLNSRVFDGGITLGEEDTVFAYQGMIGVAASVTEQLDVDVGFRYFKADEASFELNDGSGETFDMDYMHQAITVGLRYQFASPAPPPPPPPPLPPPPPPPPPVAAVCPQSDFVVYFEWDRSNLNQAALET